MKFVDVETNFSPKCVYKLLMKYNLCIRNIILGHTDGILPFENVFRANFDTNEVIYIERRTCATPYTK